MFENQKLKLASLLYSYLFPIYRLLYFRFKNNKDREHLLLIKSLIKPGDIVLDIGANIGFFARHLSEFTGPTGKLYCFEPDKTNFHHLEKELKGIESVVTVQKAVAAGPGVLTLYTSHLLNVDHRTYEPENYAGKYSVQKTSVDEFVNGNFRVDFIKMDIQGFEMEALRGMQKTLKQNENILLFMEFWPYGLQKAGSSAIEFFDLVTTLGFRVYRADKAKPVLMTRMEAEEMKVEYFADTNVLLSRKELNTV